MCTQLRLTKRSTGTLASYICCILRFYNQLISTSIIRLQFVFLLIRSKLEGSPAPLPSVMEFISWNSVWNLSFGLLATLIVVGNLLTIWIFLKRRLRKRPHFLLISLAVADLLVGLLAVPLYIAIHTWPTYFIVWPIPTMTDIFTSIASIFALAAISLERMYAIGWPFRHRTLKFRVYIFAIAMPWILAAIFTSITLLVHFSIMTLINFVYIRTLFLSIPLLVICIAYFVIFKKQKSMVGNQSHVVRETRLAKTLFIITAASLLTWLPFQIFLLMLNFGEIRNQPHFYATVLVVKVLQFSNSLVNVIIYPFRISEFKNVLLQMLRCCASVRPHDERNEVVPMHQGRPRQFHHFQELHIPNP